MSENSKRYDFTNDYERELLFKIAAKLKAIQTDSLFTKSLI